MAVRVSGFRACVECWKKAHLNLSTAPEPSPASTMPPREIDERLERGGRVAPARIVEAQGRQSGRPILEHAHKAACLDVVSHVGLHRQGETDGGEGRAARRGSLRRG